MTKLNVSVSGFFGSGSGAVIDLLKEYGNCFIALNNNEKGIERPYEHKLFYTRGGIFETTILFDRLDTAYASDIYVNSFRNNMFKFYNNNFGSFGSYKKLIGKQFLESVDQYCLEIGATKLKSGISRTEHKKSVRFSLIMASLQIAAKIIYRQPIYTFGKKNNMDKNPYFFAMPTKEENFNAARNFVNRYFEMCRKGKDGVAIFDQLIHAQHTEIIDQFFDDSFRAIIVLRDPRDLYCLSKYFWSKPPHGFKPPLPTDIEEFCDFWKKTTNFNKSASNVLPLFFEELVYDYENTLTKIESFLGLTKKDHLYPKKYFDPEKSIRNTQIFKRTKETREEAIEISQRIPNLLFKFPYNVSFGMDDIFDDMNELKK